MQYGDVAALPDEMEPMDSETTEPLEAPVAELPQESPPAFEAPVATPSEAPASDEDVEESIPVPMAVPEDLGVDSNGDVILPDGARGCADPGFTCLEGRICGFGNACEKVPTLGEPCMGTRRGIGSCPEGLVCVDLTGDAVVSVLGLSLIHI